MTWKISPALKKAGKLVLFRIWDLGFLIFIGFPLLTGGFSIDPTERFIYPEDMAAWVTLVFMIGIAISFLLRAELNDFLVFQVLRRGWASWLAMIRRFQILGIIAVAMIVATLWSWVSIQRHWSFESASFDLGIFTNAVFNLWHHGEYVSSFKNGVNLFTDHQSPILWLITPLCAQFSIPEALLVAQAIVLALGGVAAFVLTRQYCHSNRARSFLCIVPILYWLYLPIRNANAFEFHPETSMLPLFLAGIAGVQSINTRFRLFGILCLGFALLCKETAAAVLVAIGISWFIGAGPRRSINWTKKIGLISILLGIFIFYLDVWIVPKWFSTSSAYRQLYSHLGSGFSDVIFSPLLKPVEFWTSILRPKSLLYLFWTLAGLAFLPLLGWRALIAALPGYLFLFLQNNDHRLSPVFHYGIEPSVGLFWALALAIGQLDSFIAFQRKYFHLSCIWILFWCLFANGHSEIYRIRRFTPKEHHEWLRKQVLPCLTTEPIAASGHISPHLANRSWAHHLPEMKMRDGNPVTCAIYDSSVGNWPIRLPEQQRRALGALISAGFEEIYSCGSVSVFALQGTLGRCMRCEPPCRTEVRNP